MLLRKIQPTDNLQVAAIIRDVMTEFGAVGQGFSIEDAEVDSMFEAYSDERSVFYVLEDDREVIGGGGIAQLAGGEDEVCELKKMYFRGSARGLGLGRLLCETLIVDARRLGYSKIYIETLERMEAARSLYERLGFIRLAGPLGATGHCSCDAHYALELPPQEIDPSLLR